jgi:hypothetical protein
MKHTNSFLILASVFIGSLVFCISSFAEYASLCGKWAELHGPLSYKHIGVSLDEKTCAGVIGMLRAKNHKKFDKLLLKNYQILRVENKTKVLVLMTDVFEGKAKVVIFSGLYHGMSGWVPIEWLDNNDSRPRLSSIK